MIDLLMYLNGKNVDYEHRINSTKPIVINGNIVAAALAHVNEWEQAWAYVLATTPARRHDLQLCHRVLMAIAYAECQNIRIANNMACGAIQIQLYKRAGASERQKARECDMSRAKFMQYIKVYERLEQEIATWEMHIENALARIFIEY